MYPHWTKTPESEVEWFEALASLARHLRGPQGCPWDRKQTSADFTGFTKEEVGELCEALASDDNAHVEEEFGDAFFCLMAVAAAAEEEGRFRLASALQRAHEKMIRRHDHVFGRHTASTPEDAVAVWNKIKTEERRPQ